VTYGRKDSGKSLNDNESLAGKSLKNNRKKSVMSYALEESEMDDQLIPSPLKSNRS
jgi:hypothetical protein